ncbi:MAG: M1 family metallopeptidase, partial [Bacteroidetes bacterium]|nr:M1 family metallopeptidase [Bacteroidota bacterium]
MAQPDIESLAKSEMKNYTALQKYNQKRTSGDGVNIIYAALIFEPNMVNAYLKGFVNYHFLTTAFTNQINFDLRKDLTVDSVIFRNNKIAFTHNNSHILNIQLNTTLNNNITDSLKIFYQGTPDLSTRAYSINTTASGKIIATLSEPYGAHYWWPCRENLSDKIDSLDISITVDTAFKVASNGVLKNISINGSKHTFNWQHRYPIVTYLVAFAAAKYLVYSDYALLGSTNKTLEIQNYVFPFSETDARSKTPATVQIMQLFDSLFGTYPFDKEKYGHAQFTWGGGMEHQTMSFMVNYNYDLIAHELAHQWFGDKLTCGTWQDLWLNESFATYSNLICYDFLKPNNEWQTLLQNFKRDVLSLPNGSVMSKDTTENGPLFEYRTTYQKGAMVLHQLRWLIGDNAFFTGVRNYLKDQKLAYKFVRVNDLKWHFEQTSGRNLTDYFNDWITNEGYPEYKLIWQQKGINVSIDVKQTQSHPSVELYNVDLPILLRGFTKDTLIRIPINSVISNYTINLPFKIKELTFDPDNWLLAKHTILFKIPENLEAITVNPNPVADNLFITLNSFDLQNWEIIDAKGKSVLSKTYSSKILRGNIETINCTILA